MPAVRSADHNGIELATIRVSELRTELVLQNREVLHRIVRHVGKRAGDTFIVVVRAFNHEVVITGALPSDTGASTSSQTTRATYASLQQGKVQNAQADRRCWQILRLSELISRLDLCSSGIQRWWRSRHLYGLCGCTRLKGHIARRGPADLDVYLFTQSLEPGHLCANSVSTGEQMLKPVLTRTVSLRGRGHVGGYVGRSNLCADHCRTAGIRYCSNHVSVNCLA